MNKNRRQQLNGLLDGLERIKDELEAVCEEEQDYFDNMPENLQGSIRGTESEEAIDAMNDAVSALEDVISTIESIA